MRLFVDTNIFVAATLNESERGDIATEFLDVDRELSTTMFNLMEFRTVLAKKKQLDQDRVEQLLENLWDRVTVYRPDSNDLLTSYSVQERTLLYPMDCVILTTAEETNGVLVTFDSELIENGAVSPEEFLD
ncbi:type II toxin-antitoxin system VapC family toxin [Natrinema salaciae]|uniref:Predicted nucleic acid-binding protein, contains PIN domain n=1 Tax=Natrinema salaciae TaxID=1186196 RepID=A0A1H9ETK1_9EURY|nr:PIN domain-containing protein [Natrinema salaciae]SEQ29050.1 Predicted nucleic acid-binding protein, contains PIN domain [Natrinema salaciae]